jgi:Kef-type K+ transport system membrane component KefB/nucleotide-binding universal stress UspA family protein
MSRFPSPKWSIGARTGPLAWLGALMLLAATPAMAAEGGKGSETLFIAELVILMVAGRLLGEAMLRLGQPAVMGQLLAGVILGPSLFGALWPEAQHAIFPSGQAQKSMLDGISQFGILLLLLLTGMETDLKLVRKVGAAAVTVSLAGVAVPFCCGVALGWFLPDALLPRADQRLLTALFLGTALSISSIKIVAAIVRDMNFTRRDLGQVIVSSAILEDTLGWIIIAITLSLAQAGHIDLASVARSVIGTAAFLGLSFTFGRRAVILLIRWANDHFKSEFAVITAILLIMGVMALATEAVGVNTVLGAFVAGVLIGESPILTRHIDEQLRGLITAFFMPVFFGLAGLASDMTILANREIALLSLGLVAIASVGKFAGAFVGGKLGGLSWREAFALGCGMNARGSTEVIVATIGLSMGALSQNLFSMIVAMAITTTMAMPPMLRFALARVPMRRAERARLAREEMEEKGFVPKLERLLLAVDHSANGKFASRLAGLLAGQRGIPITLLPLATADDEKKKVARHKDKAADASPAKGPADDAKRSQPKEDRPDPVDVTVRALDAPSAEAIRQEAERGYDLLFVGIDTMRGRDGFHREVDRIAAAFDGPLAIVAAAGEHLEEPEESALDMLVPVNGTDVARRAAEIAVETARGADAEITALYVAGRTARVRRGARARRQEKAILDDVKDLADLYGRKIKTAIRADVAPDAAVVAAAKRNGHNLIVMGVSRRPGDQLFFGDTAAGVFKDAPISVVFVAS